MNRSALAVTLILVTGTPLGSLRGQVTATDTTGSSKRPAVLLCGTGSSPHYETVINGFLDFLGENNVATAEVDGHSYSRSSCLEKREELRAASLLYLTVSPSEKYAYESTFSVQCFDANGKKLWEESVRGPLMSSSVNSTMKKLAQNMSKKLKSRIGQPCFPTRT